MVPLSLDVLPATQAEDLLRRVSGRQDEAVGEIAARCGYLPLAICLAGAQLRAHSRWTARYLADLLSAEQGRLDHLRAGDRSVAAAFAMSFRHLPAGQQDLFRLLGVHPGPEIDAFAAAALAGMPLRDARLASSGLHADHLIQETTPGRYRLHDLTRAYARELAAELDHDAYRQALHRVLNYYCHTARTANARLVPSAGFRAPADAPALHTDTDVRDWLTTELPTLIACVEHAAAHGLQHPAAELAATLDHFLRLNGHTEQASHMYRTVAAAAAGLGDRTGEAVALTSLAFLQSHGGDLTTATDNLTRALALHTESGHQVGQARALVGLGNVQYVRGEYDAAIVSFTRAAAVFTAVRAPQGRIHALHNLGYVHYRQGRLDVAAECHQRALALSTTLAYRLGEANARNGLGVVQLQRGELDVAADNLTGALTLHIGLGSRLGQANARNGLGCLDRRRGDYDAAAGNFTQALTLFTEENDPDGVAETLNNLGDLALCHPGTGDPWDYFHRARTTARDIGAALHEAHALAGQARYLLRDNDIDAAVPLLRDAQSRYESLGAPQPDVADILSAITGGTSGSERPVSGLAGSA